MEDKEIICKVLRVDARNRRIDVSLRRVPVPVMVAKQDKLKKEEFSEKVYNDVSSKLGITKDEFFERTYEPIFENYETVFEVLYEVMLDNKKVDMFDKLSSKEKEVFIELINERIKPEEVIFKQKFIITSKNEDGAVLIKDAIQSGVDGVNYDRMNITYLAAGKFEIKIVHEDMKSADMVFEKFRGLVESKAQKDILEVTFKKQKK